MCYAGMIPFDLSAKIFFVGAKSYYDTSLKYEKEKNLKGLYAKNYKQFLTVLKIFLVEKKLYNNSIMTKDEFRLYSELFKEHNRESLDEMMEREKFIIEDEELPLYLQKLKDYIATSDIYN